MRHIVLLQPPKGVPFERVGLDIPMIPTDSEAVRSIANSHVGHAVVSNAVLAEPIPGVSVPPLAANSPVSAATAFEWDSGRYVFRFHDSDS